MKGKLLLTVSNTQLLCLLLCLFGLWSSTVYHINLFNGRFTSSHPSSSESSFRSYSFFVHALFRGVDKKDICNAVFISYDSMGNNWCPDVNAFSTSYSQLEPSPKYDARKNANIECKDNGECYTLVGVKSFIILRQLNIVKAYSDGGLTMLKNSVGQWVEVKLLRSNIDPNITHFDGVNSWDDNLEDNGYAVMNVKNQLLIYENNEQTFYYDDFIKLGNELLQFKMVRYLNSVDKYVITMERSKKQPTNYQLIFTKTYGDFDTSYIWEITSEQTVKFDVSIQMVDISQTAPLRIDQTLYFSKGYSKSARMLITLYTNNQIRIFEFNETNLLINFEQVDRLNTFYQNEAQYISIVSLISETIRKPYQILGAVSQLLIFPPSQNVYLAIGFEKEHQLLIHHVAEFAEYTSNNTQPGVNTASRIDNFPCQPNEFFNNGNCLPAMEKRIETNAPVEQISVRFSDPGISDSPNSDKYYDENGYLTYKGIIESELFTTFQLSIWADLFFNQYWQETILLVTNSISIEIVTLAFRQNNNSTGDCTLMKINTLTFPSPILYLDHSYNNQHLLVTTSRSELDFSSAMRYRQVCDKLTIEPDNVFMKPFAEACKTNPPTSFDDNKFIFYASTCIPGTHCKSLRSRSITTTVSDGKFTQGFLVRNCLQGSFCRNGLKVPCPSGMVCPLGSPRKCNTVFNAEGGFTCFREGLSSVDTCPNSAMCSTTQTEPVFAPPNHYVDIIDYSGSRRVLKVCKPGDYCNLGRFIYEQDTKRRYADIRCPADTYCPHPSILQPITCSFTNKIMDFCPVGTIENRPCPAGNYCETPHDISKCDPQQFCPNGSMSYDLCPKGYYCPTPSEKIKCPSGFYCTPGSIFPRQCSWFLSNCPEGSSSDSMTVGGIVLFIMFIILLFSLGAVYKFLRALYLKSQKNKVYKSGFLLKKESRNDSHMATHSFIKDDFTVDIGFKDLGLILRGSGKRVLDGVSGEIKHGQLTAVLGLSGCGKSTFITTLANRAYYGTQIGKIFVNGKEEPLSKYNRRIGFVPQEDIMLTTMTVEETLYFSARTRLDRSKTNSEIEAIVNDVLSVLRLEDIRHSIIGDQENRGISGGQRKRVNVGMELVASPVVLLLDEPTSGLDSASSKEVCEVLQTIASTGINVITVIHQPRFEIFKMFDNLLLLGKGGRTIYLGPLGKVEEYFKEEFNCVKPEGINFADYLMDISAGMVVDGNNSPLVDPKELPSYWEKLKSKYDGSKSTSGSGSLLDGGGLQVGYQYGPSLKVQYQDPKLNYIMQFIMCLKRSVVQQLRSLQSIALDFSLVFICASFLSLLYYNKVYIGPLPKNVYSKCPGELSNVCKQPIDDPVASYAGLMSLAMALMGSMASLRVFGKEYLVFYRESQSGLGTFAYFWSKDLANLVVNLLAPFVFLTIFYTTVSPTASVFEYYYALLLDYWVSFGLGYLVSVLVNPNNAQLTTVVIVFIFNIFSGMTTPLPTLRDMFFPIKYFPDVSYLKYSHETLYLNEMKSYRHLYDLKTSLDNMGYKWENLTTNPIALLGFGLLFRILAFLALVCVKPSSLFKLVYFSTQNFVLFKFRNLAKLLANWRDERRRRRRSGSEEEASHLNINNSSSDSISMVSN